MRTRCCRAWLLYTRMNTSNLARVRIHDNAIACIGRDEVVQIVGFT
jgi:hypothetical protein